MSELADQPFVPYRRGAPRLAREARAELARQLGEGWTIVDDHQLEREFSFADFREALAFTNRVGELSEALDHHPDVELAWGRVKLSISTHAAGGLTAGDFVWAARVDRLYGRSQPSR